MKRLLRQPRPATIQRVDSERADVLVEESREIVVVLDDQRRVLAASRRAREALAFQHSGIRSLEFT